MFPVSLFWVMESCFWVTENTLKVTRSCSSVLCLIFDCNLNQNIVIALSRSDGTELKIMQRKKTMQIVLGFPTADPSF